MNIIKNKKLLILALIALVIIILVIFAFVGRKKEETPSVVYNKTQEENRTQETPTLTQQEMEDTNKAAKEYVEQMRSVYREYPFLRKLPVNNDKYVLIWDYEKMQFRIRLKISSSSLQNVKDTLLTDALSELRSIARENLDKYGYYVLYLD